MRYPIILAHGIARFDVLSNRLFRIDNNEDGDGLHYFRNIRSFLADHGYQAFHTNVSWAGRVETRAAQLKQQIEDVLAKTQQQKVHVIAHSMGGLDARHALFDFRAHGFPAKIASLITIGTPHHGTPVADFIVAKLGWGPSAATNPIEPLPQDLYPLAVALGLDPKMLVEDTSALGPMLPSALGGILDLTTWECRAFNESASTSEEQYDIHFDAVAGVQSRRRTASILKPSWDIIERKDGGGNDGLVPASSARWSARRELETWDADHLNELGWWEPAELWGGVFSWSLERRIKARYLALARRADRYTS